MNNAYPRRRLAATGLAAALTETVLTVAAAPAAHAAASDTVAKLPITSYSALAVDSADGEWGAPPTGRPPRTDPAVVAPEPDDEGIDQELVLEDLTREQVRECGR